MNEDSINSYIQKHLPEKRIRHIQGVRQTAVRLARKYGADEEKANTAALFHDMFRSLSPDELSFWIERLGLDARYRGNVNLAHGKIAAAVMKQDYGVEDEDIINAVSYHTTGRAGMSLLEKIVFIADAIEPGRSYPGVEELRTAAEEDLDRACLLSLSKTVDYIRAQGIYLDEDTLRARDYFLRILQKERENG